MRASSWGEPCPSQTACAWRARPWRGCQVAPHGVMNALWSAREPGAQGQGGVSSALAAAGGADCQGKDNCC